MSFNFNFPRARFVDENGIVGQAYHVESELSEVWETVTLPDILRTAEEAMDLLHSVETFLHILAEKHGVNLDVVSSSVILKNQARGYYVQD